VKHFEEFCVPEFNRKEENGDPPGSLARNAGFIRQQFYLTKPCRMNPAFQSLAFAAPIGAVTRHVAKDSGDPIFERVQIIALEGWHTRAAVNRRSPDASRKLRGLRQSRSVWTAATSAPLSHGDAFLGDNAWQVFEMQSFL
jgi:hypothetical protein